MLILITAKSIKNRHLRTLKQYPLFGAVRYSRGENVQIIFALGFEKVFTK